MTSVKLRAKFSTDMTSLTPLVTPAESFVLLLTYCGELCCLNLTDQE